MASSQLEQIIGLVEEYEWLIGAVNYDEDPHFSSLYLRASTPRRASHVYPGYSTIFAFYEDFSERYYLRVDECVANAQAIVKRATRDPCWLERLLDEIEHRSEGLLKIFETNLCPKYLEDLKDHEVLALYKKHHIVHSELYTYARVPEALDRGVNYFTNYLNEYLSKIVVDPAEREEVFNALTQPVSPSVLAQEIIEFDRIVRWTSHDHILRSMVLTFPTKAHLLLSQGFLSRIDRHVERWKYLEYHGYGARKLTSRSDLIERLITSLRDDGKERRGRDILNRLAANRMKKEELFRKLKIDQTHRSLLELYPEIGAAKMNRRYAQLRNFFFLDMLIADVGRRFGVDEWTVRCMMPEEIISALEGKEEPIKSAVERRNGCMIIFWNEHEILRTGNEVVHIREQLEKQAAARVNRKVLKGVIASRGRVQGTCKIVIRSSGDARQFEKGAILVSEATDPDLLKFLKVAGGVLTQQGGVTSHAAIICREIGIPAIIGIDGLLDKVNDGDVVEVDAYTGEVRFVGDQLEPPPGLVWELGLAVDKGKVGAKAANLALLSDRGFSIPPFVLLHSEPVQKLLSDEAIAAREQFLRWIERRINLKSGDTLAIRSSSLGEDLATSSLAGEFDSILNVPTLDFWKGLATFFERNTSGRTGLRYSGAIIVQRMINGIVGGVCLTADVQNDRRDLLTIEMAQGGSHNVTGGTGIPWRLVVNKDTFDIVESSGDKGAAMEVFSTRVREVIRTFLDIEEVFKEPLDIEWVWDGESLYIVQARPIVSTKKTLRVVPEN